MRRLIARIQGADLVLAAIGLLVMLCIYFWPVVVHGQALLPADLLFDDPVWRAQAPAAYVRPSNPLLSDQVNQFLPWRLFTVEELRRGRLPLWNPYEMAGTPFVGNDQSAVFYPLNLLLAWLPAQAIPGWSAILRLLIAGSSTYALLRWWRASSAAALLAAICFALGASVLLVIGHPHTNVAVWLPFLILATDKVTRSTRPRPWALLTAFVIGVQFLGGHAETSFFVLVAWVLFALASLLATWQPAFLVRYRQRDFRTMDHAIEPASSVIGPATSFVRSDAESCPASVSRRQLAFRAGLLILAGVLGTTLAAVQLLPFLELLPNSNYFLSRSAQAQGHQPIIYLGFWRDLARLPTIVLPNIFGNPTRGDWWLGTAFLNYTGILYMGVLPFAFALAGGWLRRREWRPAFFACLALFSLAAIFRLPIIDWIRRLPLVSVASTSGGLIIIYGFCVAVLAGFGLDALLDRAYRRNLSRVARALFVLVIVIGSLLLAAYAALRALQAPILALGRRYVETVVYGKPPHPYPLEFYLSQLDERYRQIVGIFDPARLTLYLPLVFAAAGALALWAVYRGWLQRPVGSWLLVGLALADLWVFGAGFNPSLPPDQVLPVTPALRWLMSHQGYQRSVGVGDILMANTATAFRLFDLRGYDVDVGRVHDWPGTGRQLSVEQFLDPQNQPFFDLAAVRYVLSALPMAGDELKLVYDGEIKIYERSEALPRAYLARSISVVNSEEGLQAALRSPDVVNGERVLLDEEPAPGPAASQAGDGRAEIQVYEPDRVVISTNSPQAGMLVLADAYYPGWYAMVDSLPSKIYRANDLFRAVAVPAGQHTVTFRYQPLSFRIGAGLTLASLLLLVVLGVWTLMSNLLS